jgi:hypothetical protein
MCYRVNTCVIVLLYLCYWVSHGKHCPKCLDFKGHKFPICETYMISSNWYPIIQKDSIQFSFFCLHYLCLSILKCCKRILFFWSTTILKYIGYQDCYFTNYYLQNLIEKINNDELQLMFS